VSAVLNGTSAYFLLAESVLGSTPTYPVLMAGWDKLNNVTANHYLMHVGDNAAAASQDQLILAALGGVAGDPTRAWAIAAGVATSSLSDLNGVTAGAWLFNWALFTSSASRTAGRGSTFGIAETTSRAPTGLSHTAIGVLYRESAPTATTYTAGRVAEKFIASGFDIGDITTIINQLAAGSRPINVPLLAPSLVLYQPLVGGVNEATKIGADMTANNMTYDAADHPPLFGYPNYAYAQQ
jgi:hypothetical protein